MGRILSLRTFLSLQKGVAACGSLLRPAAASRCVEACCLRGAEGAVPFAFWPLHGTSPSHCCVVGICLSEAVVAAWH